MDTLYCVAENLRIIVWTREQEYYALNLTDGIRYDLDPFFGLALTVAGPSFSVQDWERLAPACGLPNPLQTLEAAVGDGIIRSATVEPTVGTIEAYAGSPIEVLVLEVTGRCNAKCSFCYAQDVRQEDGLSTEQLCRVLTDFAKLGGSAVAITGGEPACRNDLLEILHTIRSNRLLLAGIATNGLRIDERILPFLKEMPLVDSISVSIDSPDNAFHDELRGVPGLASQAWQLVARLGTNDVPVTVNTLLVAAPDSAYVALGDRLDGMGIKQWRVITPDIPMALRACNRFFFDDPDDELRLLSRLYWNWKERGWGFGFMKDAFLRWLDRSPEVFANSSAAERLCSHRSRALYVRADGEVLRCNISRKPSGYNVRDASLHEIWGNAHFQSLKNPSVPRIRECDGCPAREQGVRCDEFVCPEKDCLSGIWSCRGRLEKYKALVCEGGIRK